MELPAESLGERARAFATAFDDNDLDRVMSYFAVDAVYRTIEGQTYRGRAAIRAAFEPQFRGEFGRMRFDLEEVIADESTGRVILRWICRHDLEARAPSLSADLRRRLFRILYGARAAWYGLDVLHFDADRSLIGKYSYTTARRPRIRSEL